MTACQRLSGKKSVQLYFCTGGPFVPLHTLQTPVQFHDQCPVNRGHSSSRCDTISVNLAATQLIGFSEIDLPFMVVAQGKSRPDCWVNAVNFIGPILWGHSGPLCHALSLWTSILHCHSSGVATVARRLRYSYSWLRLILVVVSTVATPGEWQCKIRTGGVRQLAVANGSNIFQMLLVVQLGLFTRLSRAFNVREHFVIPVWISLSLLFAQLRRMQS